MAQFLGKKNVPLENRPGNFRMMSGIFLQTMVKASGFESTGTIGPLIQVYQKN
jgi:hypothetical protein